MPLVPCYNVNMATKQPDDGNWVAEAIRRMGGQTKVVVATGVSAGTIARWRQIREIPDVKTLLLISEKTGIAPRLLAGLDQPVDTEAEVRR